MSHYRRQAGKKIRLFSFPHSLRSFRLGFSSKEKKKTLSLASVRKMQGFSKVSTMRKYHGSGLQLNITVGKPNSTIDARRTLHVHCMGMINSHARLLQLGETHSPKVLINAVVYHVYGSREIMLYKKARIIFLSWTWITRRNYVRGTLLCTLRAFATQIYIKYMSLSF